MRVKTNLNVKTQTIKDQIVCALTEEGKLIKVTKNYIDNDFDSYEIWILEE